MVSMVGDDFYEDDEPTEDIYAVYESGEKRVTARPVRGWTQYLNPAPAAGHQEVSQADRSARPGVRVTPGDRLTAASNR